MIPFLIAGAGVGLILALYNTKNKKNPNISEPTKEPKIKIVDSESGTVDDVVEAKITASSNKNLDKMDKDDKVDEDSNISE